ncbi:MAG: glycosyltransferase family 39 protein [Thermodesulfobacteriota bacterium]
MIFFSVASLLLAWMIGLLITWIFFPAGKEKAAGILLRLAAAGGLGIGVTSCGYFVCLLAGLARFTPLFDLALCLALGLVWWRRRRRSGARGPDAAAGRTPAGSFLEKLIAALSAGGLAAYAVSFAAAFLKEPHGRWDAWLIWNMHARFLYRGGERWRDAFASGLDWSHWDYPLLLPLSAARGWTYAGGESVLFPALLGFVFTLLVLGLLLGALWLLRGRTQGCLAAMVLMGTPFFLTMGAAQFADIPFAFFMLGTFVMLFLSERSPDHRAGALILAGVAAALGAWTKNEGLLFALVVTVSLAGMAAHAGGWSASFKQTGRFLAGALPVLLIVVYFKARLSPANDIMEGVSLAAVSANLVDWGRYTEIARAFFFTGISFTQGVVDVREGMRFNPGAVSVLLLVAYLLISGVRIDRQERECFLQAGAILVLMLTGYFFVYVVTPLDLHWHLMTSLNRLFLQLWPSAVFLAFMAAGIPGQRAPAQGAPAAASPQAKGSPARGKAARKRKDSK